MLSIPRDLVVPIAGTGAENRINAAFTEGPGQLVKTIEQNFGVPIHHYVLIDFLCRVKGGALRAGSDVSEARWIDVGELEDLAVRERTVAVIRKGVRASCGVKP